MTPTDDDDSAWELPISQQLDQLREDIAAECARILDRVRRLSEDAREAFQKIYDSATAEMAKTEASCTWSRSPRSYEEKRALLEESLANIEQLQEITVDDGTGPPREVTVDEILEEDRGAP